MTGVFLLFSLLFNVGCNKLSKRGETQKPEDSNKIVTNRTVNLSSKTPLLKPLRVWVGSVSYYKEKVRPVGVWSGGDETPSDIPEEKGGIKIGTSYKVDILNCKGYLSSGHIQFTDKDGFSPNWNVVFNLETISADIRKKIKQCPSDSDNPKSTTAFAVTPTNRNRRKIKVGDIDTNKLFDSLPEDIKTSLNSKYALAGGRKMNTLSLTQDSWTDILGNGKINLVYVFGDYDEEHSSGDILLLENGKWKYIGQARD